jgi:mannose-1-phosphate guanylyltransferase
MTISNYYAVIMAGGGGTRLWPLSRQGRPKQTIPLLGDRTLFQIAVARLTPLLPPERILVVTNARFAEMLMPQAPEVPEANFVIEPAPRNTAPALGLAAVEVLRRDPQAVMACLTADHFIRDENRFRALLTAAHELALGDWLVTLGIEPTYAATGFGYIQRAGSLGRRGVFDVFEAARFREKPSQPEAEAMLADGQHSWNSGMFVWKAGRLLEEFEIQMPSFARALGQVQADPSALAAIWPHVPSTSIDYGVMEGASRVAVIPASGLGWNDVGSWESLFEVLPADGAGNVAIGTELLDIDTRHTLVHAARSGRRLVAALGVEDLIIVDTGDVLLICPKHRAQDVRAFVDALKSRPDGQAFL